MTFEPERITDDDAKGKRSLLNVAGKTISGRIVVKRNRLRNWKGRSTLSIYTYQLFQDMEKEKLGSVLEKIANSNTKVC